MCVILVFLVVIGCFFAVLMLLSMMMLRAIRRDSFDYDSKHMWNEMDGELLESARSKQE